MCELQSSPNRDAGAIVLRSGLISVAMMRTQSLYTLKTVLPSLKFPDTGFTRVAVVSAQIETLRGLQTEIDHTKILMPSHANSGSFKSFCVVEAAEYGGLVEKDEAELLDDDEEDELCPVECVREFYNDDEFLKILDKAKDTNSLVVVDFYRTACGSCKYIEQGFAKLCRKSGDEEDHVIFLKHNVIDEYDEQSEVAERLRIKTVPLFHFYRNGVLLEAFPTRDKERIMSAISKYTSTSLDSPLL